MQLQSQIHNNKIKSIRSLFFRFNQLFKLCVTWGNLLKRILFTQQLNDRAKQKGHWNSGSSRALSISALWMAETVTWLCIMLYFVLRQWRGVTSLRCSVAVPVLSRDEYNTYIHHYTAYKTPEDTDTHSWAGAQNNVRPFEFSTFCGSKPQENNRYWDMMRPTANDTRFRKVKYYSMQLTIWFLCGWGGGGVINTENPMFKIVPITSRGRYAQVKLNNMKIGRIICEVYGFKLYHDLQ